MISRRITYIVYVTSLLSGALIGYGLGYGILLLGARGWGLMAMFIPPLLLLILIVMLVVVWRTRDSWYTYLFDYGFYISKIFFTWRLVMSYFFILGLTGITVATVAGTIWEAGQPLVFTSLYQVVLVITFALLGLTLGILLIPWLNEKAHKEYLNKIRQEQKEIISREKKELISMIDRALEE